MDDFYTSMSESGIFDKSENDEYSSGSIPVNSDYTSHLYANAQTVDALITINLMKWSGFGAGSVLTSDMQDLGGKLGTPFNNLLVAQEYLSTAKSDSQYRARFWNVIDDTIKINALAEADNYLGPVLAGASSNKIADRYMNEMIETEVSLSRDEKLNLEICKVTAKEKGLNVDAVRGVGTFRQFLPDTLKSDMCIRPESGTERPNNWVLGSSDDGLDFEWKSPNSNPEPGSGPDSNALDFPNQNDSSSNPGIIGEQDFDNNNSSGPFGWLRSMFGSTSPMYDEPSNSFCPADHEREREEMEKNFLLMGSGSGSPFEIDHPINNPPPIGLEFVGFPDSN